MKPVLIAGGGLAGLALGIQLRQGNVPCTIFESASYPRHRVCGEFISGHGQRLLRAVNGVVERCQTATEAAFFTMRRGSAPAQLPAPALCISRYELDAFLAERFTALGGELHQNTRMRDSTQAPGTVLATGRRKAEQAGRWQWFGLKVHARNVHLGTGLEMHLGKRGYVGLCRLPGEEVNVCGLFRKRAGAAEHAHIPPMELLRGEPGSLLRQRLASAEFVDGTFCAVAGLDLGAQLNVPENELRVGDALTMTPPITGNGMSMAFESAHLASQHLLEYSSGAISWAEAVSRANAAFEAAFNSRLAWARRLQNALFLPFTHAIAPLLLWNYSVVQVLFRRTRSF